MGDLQELAARRLAALGDSFLSAFDDEEEKQRAAAVARLQRSSGASQSSEKEESSSTDASSDDSGDASSDSGEDPSAGRVQVFEFDSKTVRPQTQKRGSAPQSAAPVRGSRPNKGGSHGLAAAATEPGSDALSTWTGSRSELASLQRQVQTYGAAALDKKSKRQFEATELAKLGARPEKAPRMPASVGKGMKRKHDARAEAAQEEAIEAGHVSRAAIAKLRRRAKESKKPKMPDGGLLEDGGAFRGGVLHVAAKGMPYGGRRGGKRKKQQGRKRGAE